MVIEGIRSISDPGVSPLRRAGLLRCASSRLMSQEVV
jgi:hypothetical protein